MSRVLRKCQRVCYYEPEEPSFDEYIFCAHCGDYVYEYCSIHGPLLVIPDDKVPCPTGYPPFVPRAALTVPRAFLHLAASRIPGVEIGVFSTLTLPPGVRFGPYRGARTGRGGSTYAWQIYDRDNKPSHLVDGRDPNGSNWMRYVNCSRNADEQNLVAFQYQSQIYYRTIKLVPRFTELLIFYGSEFALELGVNLSGYHATDYKNTDTKIKKTKDQNKTEDDSLSIKKKKLNIGLGPDYTNNDTNAEYFEVAQVPDKDNFNALTNVNTNSVEIHNIYEPRETDIYLESYPTDFVEDIRVETPQNLINTINEENKVTDTVKPLNNEGGNIEIKVFSCSLCDYKSAYNYLFKTHVKRHNRDKSYKCNICDFDGVSRHALYRHYRMHADEKHSGTNLDKHISTQSTEQNKKHWKCFCGAAFERSYGLRRHTIIHTGERKFRCHVCSSKFFAKYQLIRHMKRRHPEVEVVDTGRQVK